MGFLVGKTKEQSGVNKETSGLDKALIDYIRGQGFGGLNPGTSVDQNLIEPYQQLFRQQNAQNFAQAKESAGNLTGSSLGNILGLSAQRASTEQGAQLTGLLEQRRQADASRFLQLILGTLGSPAGQVTQTYQPGLLDTLGSAAGKAAPFLIPGAGAAAGGVSAASAGTGGQLGPASLYHFPTGGRP